jgi:hypothetical protein|tara:strand:- start:160 stop:408 length:249 start_codon:yes stop_codon:yes gene_type:complete
MTLKQHRREIISKISMRSDKMDWDYAIQLAKEWEAEEEKFTMILDLGDWSAWDLGCDAWINRVENHLERVLAHIRGESYSLR